jgi:Flp pilus assembly pilin Flp
MVRRFTAVGRLFARCMRDERGGETVEFALTVGLVGAGAYAYTESMGVKVRMLWQRLDDALGKF